MNDFLVKSFYDEDTATVTYVVYDKATKDALVIDPVLDYDQGASRYFTTSLEQLEKFVNEEKLKLHYSLETHAHADHLSGAQWLKKKFPEIKIAIGARITEVQSIFKNVFNLTDSFLTNGSQFDQLLKDGEILKVGSLSVQVINTPGHTPACISFLIGDALFTGDALFMPDTGTGRCDFPAGSSESLYESIKNKIYTLPDSTRVFVGHDYKANGIRSAEWESTIGRQKEMNIQLNAQTAKSDFIQMRNSRDITLSAPRLLLPSIQVNINAGNIPNPENNGMSYLKIPIRPK